MTIFRRLPGRAVPFATALRAVLVGLLVLSACGDGSQRKGVDRAKSYVRVTARFEHVATGEAVVADVVAACGGRVRQWQSDEPTKGFYIYPEADFTPLPGGGVLMMRMPSLCEWQVFNASKNGTIRRIGPDTLLPVMVWFPDEHDLAAGWSYVTEKAYESPISPVRWLGTDYRPASEEEWRAWRAERAAAWEPHGAVPSPWGWGYYRQTDDVRARFEAANQGRSLTFGACSGYARAKAPAELVDRAFAERPDWEGRYLKFDFLPGTAVLAKLDPPPTDPLARLGYDTKKLFYGDDAWRSPPGNAASGAMTHAGSGYLDAEQNGAPPYVMADYFPYLGWYVDRSRLPYSAGEFGHGTLLTDERYDGFAACGLANDAEREAGAPWGDEVFYVNDTATEPMWQHGNSPQWVFDREENYVYRRANRL